MPPVSLSRSDLTTEKLLAYLRQVENFPFFRDKSTKCVGLVEDADFGQENRPPNLPRLLDIWQHVMTDALWHLKSKDTREVKGDGPDYGSFFDEDSLGVTELRMMIEAFVQFETHLYAASPERYRDHVVHSFRVWLIGHKILRESLGGTLAADKPEGLKTIEDTEWFCMWALAALCHDIGYPLTKVDEVNEHAKKMLRQQGFRSLGDMRFSFSAEAEPFNEVILRLMSSKVVKLPQGDGSERGDYLTHLQNKYYLKFLKSFDQLQHGTISAVLMAKALTYFLESDLSHDAVDPLESEDARQFLIRREILRAIASHTCPDIYHLGFNTLSFLLFMVDEIQDSERPTLDAMQGGEDTNWACERFSFSEKSVEVQMETSLRRKDAKDRKWLRRRLGNVRRRLRLAVGTSKMGELRLHYSITTPDPAEDGEPVCLAMQPDEDGKLGIRIIGLPDDEVDAP